MKFIVKLTLFYILCQCKQTNIVFGIRAKLCEANEIYTVFLGIETGWKVITIALVIAVVEAAELKEKFVKILLNHDKYFGGFLLFSL